MVIMLIMEFITPMGLIIMFTNHMESNIHFRLYQSFLNMKVFLELKSFNQNIMLRK